MGGIVTLTGPENVGKTTQALLLVDWFRKNTKQKVEHMHFPSTPYMRSQLSKLATSKDSASAMQVLFQTDRILMQDKIKSLLNANYIIVCDRYDIDTWFYGLVQGLDSQFLRHTMTAGIIPSDYVIRMFGYSWNRPHAQDTDGIGTLFDQDKLHYVYRTNPLPVGFNVSGEWDVVLSKTSTKEEVRQEIAEIAKGIAYESAKPRAR